MSKPDRIDCARNDPVRMALAPLDAGFSPDVQSVRFTALLFALLGVLFFVVGLRMEPNT